MGAYDSKTIERSESLSALASYFNSKLAVEDKTIFFIEDKEVAFKNPPAPAQIELETQEVERIS